MFLVSATSYSITVLVLLLIIAILIKVFFVYYKKVSDYNRQLMKVANTKGLPTKSEVASSINKLEEKVKIEKKINTTSKLQLETIINTINAPLIAVDLDYNIIFYNKALKKHYNTNNDLRDKKIYKVIIDNNVIELLDECKKTLKLQKRRQTYLGKFLRYTALPIIDKDEVSGYLLLIDDLSSIVELQNYKEQFLSDVTHELKTPLTSIRGFTETLKMTNTTKKQHDEFLSIILDESNRAVNLINDILTMQKLNEINTKDFENINVLTIVNNVLKVMHSDNDDVDIIIDVNIDCTIFTRKDNLMQILINLLSNAIRHTAKGHIKISTIEAQSDVTLVVEDTGEGIPYNEQEAVFKRFYRIDKARSREKGGTGLGLSIVSKIVEQNSANIKLESEPGKGTRVSIIFNKQ